MSDIFFSDYALKLAEKAVNPAPNPRVGAVVARTGKIVSEGFHECAGQPHAEVIALKKAGKKAVGATLYVTLEPCNHRGRTLPCTQAILKAGIKKVVIGMRDPNPVATGGADLLKKHGLIVRTGVREKACRKLNQIWLKNLKQKIPYITLKLAFTSAGGLISPPGKKWITGATARWRVQKMRAQHDAILVGVNTVITDDPRLTVRNSARQPVRVILDPNGRIPRSARIFRELGETIIVTKKSVKFPRAENLAVPNFELPLILKKLCKLGITGILIEGGEVTARRFLADGLVDQVSCFYAFPLTPKKLNLFGKSFRLKDEQSEKIGKDTLLTGFLKKY